MDSFPTTKEQLAVLRRGVAQIVTEAELVEKLEQSRKTRRPLRVKYGIDPTAIHVHLGHTVPLRKLRQFQRLGHQAVIVIGNYTALVGDPSGRDETRARLTAEQIAQNARDYLHQVGKVVDLSKAEVVHNGDWFARMGFADVLELTSKITMLRMLERDDFSKRIREQKPVYLHECLYPLMQGWDSVEIRADVELGGTEQLFNLLCGRDLQRDAGQTPQVAMTMPILVGTDGQRRMGKSLGNYIGIAEPPEEMFGKLMSIPDAVMRSYFELLTDLEAGEVDALLAEGAHPKEAKVRLAKGIVGEYHGVRAADAAADEFERRFRLKQLPAEIPEVRLPAEWRQPNGKVWIVRLLVHAGLCRSSSEARRAIEQGGVYVGEEKQKVTDVSLELVVDSPVLVWVGTRRVVRVGGGK